MVYVIGLFVSGILGLLILQPFGGGQLGFLLGLVLGPVGVVAAAIQRSNLRREELNAQHREMVSAVAAYSSRQADNA